MYDHILKRTYKPIHAYANTHINIYTHTHTLTQKHIYSMYTLVIYSDISAERERERETIAVYLW